MMSRKIESSVLGQRGRNKSNSCYLVPNCQMKSFHEHDVHEIVEN